MLLRADSAFFTHDVVAAARRADARFSITARLNPAVTAAISSLDQDGWTPIQDPNALWDAEEHRWISDAEVAEVPFTAFTSRRKAEHLTARLLVRRVKRLNPRSTSGSSTEQGELFAAYRYHAVFTDSPLALIDADQTHRAHAIIEQVIADLKNGPLAHLPSGKFNANAAWLVLAAIAFNLTRAAGCLPPGSTPKATTGTLRAQLINVPARLARSARRLVLHLPQHWPWQAGLQQLLTATTGPPPPRP